MQIRKRAVNLYPQQHNLQQQENPEAPTADLSLPPSSVCQLHSIFWTPLESESWKLEEQPPCTLRQGVSEIWGADECSHSHGLWDWCCAPPEHQSVCRGAQGERWAMEEPLGQGPALCLSIVWAGKAIQNFLLPHNRAVGNMWETRGSVRHGHLRRVNPKVGIHCLAHGGQMQQWKWEGSPFVPNERWLSPAGYVIGTRCPDRSDSDWDQEKRISQICLHFRWAQ